MAKAKGAPSTFVIAPDDYHAEFCGKTADGRQLFLTTPFVPARGKNAGEEFLALYTFDAAGKLLDAVIERFGPRKTLDDEARVARRDALLASLGKWRPAKIRIAPFSVERFGIAFGFVARPPDEEGEDWAVTLEPGDFMCFWPPWTSGIYDT